MPIEAVKCKNCGHAFELLWMPSWSTPTNQDREGDDCENLACIVCGATERAPATSTIMKSELTFPYFDHGLGREITSHGHRRAVMRELNVVEAGGERGTWDDMAERQAAQNEAIDKRYAAYVEEMTTGPARGEFAQLQQVVAQKHAAALEHAREQRKQQHEQWKEECARAHWESNRKSGRG